VEEKYRFKKGVWYNNIGTTNFRKCSENSNECIPYEERIENGVYEKHLANAYWGNAEEVSLEMIQQYLPDGHEDKLNNQGVTPPIGMFGYEGPTNKKENILEQCKKKYPIGTKFYPAHVTNPRIDEYCIVTTNEFKLDYNDCDVIAISNKGNDWESGYNENGNCVYNRLVYSDGKWAKIIEEKQTKEITGDNLLPNEIYVTNKPTDYIFKTSNTGKGYSSYIYEFNNYNSITPNKDYIWEGNLRLATFEEKKWLNTCISQDKFIPRGDLHLYEESGLLISKKCDSVEEKPEYYECFEATRGSGFTAGKIYKIRNPNNLEDYENFIDDIGEPSGWCCTNYKHFRPSTKEAFDRQQNKVMKDPNGKLIPRTGWWYVLEKQHTSHWYKGFIFQIGEIRGEYIHPMKNGEIDLSASISIKGIFQDCREALMHEIPSYMTISNELLNTFSGKILSINSPNIIIKNRNKQPQQPIQKRVKLNIKQINQTIKIKHYV